MTRHPDALRFVPAGASLGELRAAVQACRGCDLYRYATQAVFGEGSPKARLVMVGEEPGDREDLAGRPFVGPAGRLLDRALADAGIDRADVYLTNTVKHFKFEVRGKRRIHKKPLAREIAACKPWLDAELDCLHADVVVCLGATAAQAVIGRQHRLLEQRGEFFPHPKAGRVTATVHPSAVLRAPDAARRQQAYAAFVRDLKAVKRMLRAMNRAA